MIFLKGLRVLMYHRVDKNQSNGLTVHLNNFKEQIEWLEKNKFYFCHPDDLINPHFEHSRGVFITFDDAYADNYDTAISYLNQKKIPSMTFVPTHYIGGLNQWDEQQIPLASIDQLKSQEKYPYHFYGIHCHEHKSYRQKNLKEVVIDLETAQSTLKNLKVPFYPFLAYPYGHYPKQDSALFFNGIKSAGINLAFRIGQRLNSLPLKNKHRIERIDMRGDVSEASLRFKIRFGKLF